MTSPLIKRVLKLLAKCLVPVSREGVSRSNKKFEESLRNRIPPETSDRNILDYEFPSRSVRA